MPGASAARLFGKVILVAGGTSGIGRAVARRLAVEGARVLLAGRRVDAGEQIAQEIRAAGGAAVFQRADVTVEDEVAGLVRTAVTRLGGLHGAVNNAGGVNVAGPVGSVDDAAWRAELDQNLTSVFYGLKHQVPAIAAPEEVAAFAAFLLSNEAAFITGAALAMDGGFTAQ